MDQFSKGSIHFNCNDPFPNLSICPIMGECNGMLLDCDELIIVGSEITPGKCLYKNCVKAFNKTFLNNKSDTPWRDVLKLSIEEKPEWRALYKSPLAKKTGDLQWRILHGAIAVNVFISLFKSDGTDCCPFCLQRETLFHAFMYCERLKPLFDMLEILFNYFNVMFSMKVFICGFKYVKSRCYKSQLINFLLGQAKMAIYVTRKEKVDMNINKSLVAVFSKLVKSRILIDFLYYKSMHDLLRFETIWCLKGIICKVVEEELCFSIHVR